MDRNANDMLIMHGTMDNLYVFLEKEREFENLTKVDPGDKLTLRADEERRHRAWILIAYLINDMHGMGIIDENTRYGIIDIIDDALNKGKAIDGNTSPDK